MEKRRSQGDFLLGRGSSGDALDVEGLISLTNKSRAEAMIAEAVAGGVEPPGRWPA